MLCLSRAPTEWWWRYCFFHFLSFFPPHTMKNQIIVVYIIIVGYVGHSLSMLACLLSLLLLLLPHFFLSVLAVRFSLHALPDTRRPNTDRVRKHIASMDGVAENHTNSLRHGRQKRFSLLTAAAVAIQTEMRRCIATYTDITTKTKVKKSIWTVFCMHATDIWKLKRSRQHTSIQTTTRDEQKKPLRWKHRLKRSNEQWRWRQWHGKMFTDIRQRFSWTHSTRCVLCG